MSKSGKLRYSIVHVPPEISPLKFRGWFRTEAESIQATATGEDDIILVRLFVLEKIIFGLGMSKVDDILQGVVDKCKNIVRIELEPIKQALTFDEMQQVAAAAQDDLNEIGKELSGKAANDETLH